MSEHEDVKITELRVRGYLSGIRGESDEMFTHPYDRFDWEMDSGLEDSDAESKNDEADGGSDEQSESDSGDESGDESE
jgi:ribosome modulation factor